MEKDTEEIFSVPVPIELVPDYLEHVKTPMDLGTMKKKVNKGAYSESGIDGIETDFHQIIKNCKIYNKPDTEYVRLANVLLAWGDELIAAFRSDPGQPLPGGRPLRKRSRGGTEDSSSPSKRQK